jgi:hypothetical protein
MVCYFPSKSCERGVIERKTVIFTAGDALSSMKISEITLPKIKDAGQIRFFAPLLVAKHAAKYLTPGPESSIILTTGSVGDHPIPEWSVIAGYASGLHGSKYPLNSVSLIFWEMGLTWDSDTKFGY